MKGLEDKVGKSQKVKQKTEKREKKENRTEIKLGGHCRKNIIELTGFLKRAEREAVTGKERPVES